MKNLRKTKYGLECDQNWDAMSVISSGCRNCEHCSKPVTDFTSWSREAIVDHYKKNPKACGVFNTDQLDVPVFTFDLRSPVKTMRAMAAIVFVFIFTNLKAQEKQQTEVRTEQVTKECKPLSFYDVGNGIRTDVDPEGSKQNTPEVKKIKRKKFFLSWRFPFIHKRKTIMGKRMRVMGCPSF